MNRFKIHIVSYALLTFSLCNLTASAATTTTIPSPTPTATASTSSSATPRPPLEPYGTPDTFKLEKTADAYDFASAKVAAQAMDAIPLDLHVEYLKQNWKDEQLLNTFLQNWGKVSATEIYLAPVSDD